MRFLKFRADQLFDGYQFLGDNKVLITTEDGTIENLVNTEEAGDDVQQLDGILSPGFINCHCHLELSHMKGVIPENTGLPEFVWNIVTQRHFSEEEMLSAIEKAEDEMLDYGIVAVGDICNNALTLQQKTKGRIWYNNFIETSGFHPSIAPARFDNCITLFRAYGQLYSIPIESNSIVPHSAYSVSDELWEKIIQFPGNHVMTVHNQESQDENDWFRDKTGSFNLLFEKMKLDTSFFQPTGKSSLQSFFSHFLHNQSVILVHNVTTSANDIEYVKQSGKNVYWCLCPNANQYITRSLPPVELLLKENCMMVLGTDSLASNHQLSIAAEISTLLQYFPELSIETLLGWATANGAKALQVDQLLGSFEKNKKPGVICINEDFSSVKRLI